VDFKGTVNANDFCGAGLPISNTAYATAFFMQNVYSLMSNTTKERQLNALAISK
jgi:hypothetical protein